MFGRDTTPSNILCAVCLAQVAVELVEVEGKKGEYLPACRECSDRVGDFIPAEAAARYMGENDAQV